MAETLTAKAAFGRAYDVLKTDLGRRACSEGWQGQLFYFVREHGRNRMRANGTSCAPRLPASQKSAAVGATLPPSPPIRKKLNVSKGSPMALSEVFPPESSKTIEHPGRKTASTKIPITARELVEWTYAVQRAQGVPDIYAERQEWSQTGIVIGRLIDFAHLGCRVDVSSNAAAIWGETKCHEDAITVHGAVRDLRWRTQELLIEHGRQRQVPDWSPKTFPLACVPVRGNGGKPKGIYLNSGNKRVGSEITYVGDWPSRDFAMEARIAGDAQKRLWADPANWPAMRIRRRERPMAAEHSWCDEPFRRCADEVLARAREVYRLWYEGLRALCDGLEASGPRGLSRYRIAGLGAAYEPWRA